MLEWGGSTLLLFYDFRLLSQSNSVQINVKATWPEWKIKVVFMSICVPECLLHPSALSNKPGYFQVWVCFFYRRAGTRVWKKCSLQTTSVTTTVLEVGQQAGRVFSYSQANKKKKVLTKAWVCLCARYPSHLYPPAQADYLATALAESLRWHTHWNPQKQTASHRFPQSLLLYWNLECIAVAAGSVLTSIKALVQCGLRKN